ncbi:MAG: hypothetical protein IVW57_02620 [Ktedonobacterales bacterium]|nr:hypothetical protein [Ktedonobacterales bacterium]
METRRAMSEAMSELAREITRLERRLEQRWRDLAMAERRGQPAHVLERMYSAYLRELDAYVRAQRTLAGREPRSRLAS